MKAISSAILIAGMACLVPAQAMADEVTISLGDLFKKARAVARTQKAMAPAPAVNRPNRGAAQRFIGKKSDDYGNLAGEYITIAGCVSPSTIPADLDGLCEYEVQLIADGAKGHAPVALLLLKTRLKIRPVRDDEGSQPDTGYRVVDAIVTQDYPGYTLDMYDCAINGKLDQAVFAYAYQTFHDKSKGPPRRQKAGSTVKAFRADYQNDQIVEIPAAGVTCKGDY